MNNKIRIACCMIASIPAALLADGAMDRQIEDAASNSYTYKVVLDGRVNVKADAGAVTLTGTVPDKSDRSLAEETARNLPGVVSVNDEIAVDPSYPLYSDAWIGFKVHSLLLIRANVSASSTKVTVKDGVVTLTGTAATDAQKDLTGAYANSVSHVKSVVNEIEVKPAPAPEESAGNAIDDASITGEVKYALLADSNTSAIRTKVTTDHGVVIITGVAASDAEKDIVTRMAQGVRGVKSVNNLMTVGTSS
jgi:osmotically-inducible protein OsmY